MSQYVVIIGYLLVAVGRGSGLTGLSSPDTMTTPTAPPTRASSLLAPLVGPGTSDGQNHSLANLSLSFYPLHVNISGSPLPHSGNTDFLSLPLASSTSSVTVPTTSSPRGGSTVPQSTNQETNLSSTNTPDYKPTSSTNQPTTLDVTNLTKEHVQTVSQNSAREWFVRRKHKGPFFETRVRKLSAALRSPEFNTVSQENKHRRFNISETTPNVQDIPTGTTTKKNIVNIISHKKFALSRSAQKTRLTEIPQSLHQKNGSKKAVLVDRHRKRPISMGIPASSTVLLTPTPSPSPSPATEGVIENSQDSDEYYSSYGEYPDLPLMGYNSSGYAEAAVLPDPEVEVEDEEVEAEPEVALPDDSLADTDLHDHDLIDSVMYIYFGSSERDERGAGRQVLIVGAVISLVAQFLTLVSVLRRLHSHPSESASLILLNAELALTAANLVFMLGVQATGSKRRCEVVAVTLHYLHLVTCCWFLVNSVFSYTGLHKSETRRRLRPWWLAAWCGPAAVVVMSVLFNRRGYETRAFCWMSVARGMLYSFMVPVAILILLNTCLAVLGLRQLSLSAKTEDSDRKSMRVSATLLPVFAVVWFLGVVALENSASLVFPLLFVACGGFLNWFVLACWLPADLSLWRESDEDYEDDDDDIYEEVLKSHTDSQPLLEDPAQVYACGRRDPCDLQMDPICTISSYSSHYSPQLNTI